MPDNAQGRRLNLPSLSLPLRVLFTSYLLVTGVGLLMAVAQIMLTHGKADGQPGLSVDDVVYSYYGDRDGSVLEAKLDGSMKDKAPPQVRARIVRWVRDGASEEQWNAEIGGLVATNCTRCHSPATGLPDFTRYEVIKQRAQIDEGKPIDALARVSHIHLFGISFIWFFVGLIFSLSVRLPSWVKGVAIALPFAFLIADVLGWWMTKWTPGFAWLTIIGGAGANAATGFMLLASLYQMWVMPRKGERFDESPWFRV